MFQVRSPVGRQAASPSDVADVAVLLATCNGQPYLQEQLESLFSQRGVKVVAFLSDDNSTDHTLDIARRMASTHPMTILDPPEFKLGSANRNFMRLIHDAPIADANYVAFSDQDDVWVADKLRVAVESLISQGADGYSSNVTAFWPDGHKRLLKKSQSQRRLDHFFESASAGCTFVLTRRAFDLIRAWVRSDYDRALRLRIHDWAIYAFVRHRGMKWIIDPRSTIDYRQHGSNEVGANIGWRAARARMRHLLDGRFRQEALDMAEALHMDHPIFHRLSRLSAFDRLRLVASARHCRRRFRDAMMLAVFFLFTKKR